MRISSMTALLSLLADAALLALSLYSSETFAWLVIVRLALFAAQLFEVVGRRLHPKVTNPRRTAPTYGSGSSFSVRTIVTCTPLSIIERREWPTNYGGLTS